MKQKWKKVIAVIMAVTMLGCVVDQFPQSAARETLAAERADAAQVYSIDELQPDMTGNLNAQNYHTYGELVTFYLVAEESGYMRVMKYDKNWQLRASLDLDSNNGGFLGHNSSGNNGGVVNLCDAGSLNMTEYEGHLYINSCYTGVDGHQRSMMFDIVEADMSPVQTTYSVADYYAWVSHSYTQFLLVDDGLSPVRMVTLNHGDGMNKSRFPPHSL